MITMLGAPCGARNGWMVGARASRASRAGGDATLAWGIGNTVRLPIGVCARAPVIVPNAATIAVLAVFRSRVRRFILTSLCHEMLECLRRRQGQAGSQEREMRFIGRRTLLFIGSSPSVVTNIERIVHKAAISQTSVML